MSLKINAGSFSPNPMDKNIFDHPHSAFRVQEKSWLPPFFKIIFLVYFYNFNTLILQNN